MAPSSIHPGMRSDDHLRESPHPQREWTQSTEPIPGGHNHTARFHCLAHYFREQSTIGLNLRRDPTHILHDLGEMTRCGRSLPWSAVAPATAFRACKCLKDNFADLTRFNVVVGILLNL